tara:strand:+ start:7110 stop:8963 length:1854 start_codon:yes stop_codon:yes gene_type:complete
MIGASGIYNFNKSDKIINLKKSYFNKNLGLICSKIIKKKFLIEYVQNNLKEEVYIDGENYYLCLGEIYDGKYLGEVRNKSKLLYNFNKKNQIKKFARLNGSYIFIIIQKDKVTIGCDQNSFIPIFYSLENKILRFSYDINSIIDNSDDPIKLDYHNFASTIMTGGQGFDDSSRISGIKKLDRGSILQIYANKIIEIKGDIFTYNPKYKSLEKHLNGVSQKLKHAISTRINEMNNIGLGLSGGIDSRVLLAGIKNASNINVTTFIYGKSNFIESKISKKLSKYFKTKHINYELPDLLHIKTKNDSAFYTGGETPITTNPQIHVFGSLQKSGLEALTVGSALDCTAGNAWMLEEFYKFKTKKQLLNTYLNGHVFKFTREKFGNIFKNKKIADEYYDYTYENMKKLLYSIKGDNIADINSSFFFESRGKRWYNNALVLMLAQNKVLIPFYDKNFLNKLSEIPTELRRNDLFRIKLLKKLDEGSASFDYDTIRSPAWTEPPLNMILKKNMKYLEASKNQEWFNSGFKNYYSSNTYDANFFEWICKYKEYQKYIKNTLINKNSILSNSILNKKYIEHIIKRQIGGDNSNLRTLLILLSLETSSRLFLDKSYHPNSIIKLKTS